MKIKYRYSLPYSLNEISSNALKLNLNRNVFYENSHRCIALAFNGNRLIEYGVNIKKTHPDYAEYFIPPRNSIHAEINLILKLKYKINKNLVKKITDIISIRGTKKLYDSHPCKLCFNHFRKEFPYVRLWYIKNGNWFFKIL